MCKFESLSLNNLLNICMISRTSPSERNSAKIEPSFSWLHWTRADPPMNLKFVALWRLSLRPARPRASTLCIFCALGQKWPMTARREEIVRGHKQSCTNCAASFPRGSRCKRPLPSCQIKWRMAGLRNRSNIILLLPFLGISVSGLLPPGG